MVATKHGNLATNRYQPPVHAARSVSVIAFGHRKFLRRFAGLLVIDVFIIACSPASKPATSSPAAGPTALWGPVTPVVSVFELMRDLIDPIADNVFESVKIVVDKHGTVETKPRTDEDWDRVRIGATTLVEASQLLLVPRPLAARDQEQQRRT